MTLCIILNGTDKERGSYQVYGSDSRAEIFPISTTDRAEKHFKIGNQSGICAAGVANYMRELLDDIQLDPTVASEKQIQNLAGKIGEKYLHVWERHVRPRRIRADAYQRPMEPFDLHVAVGGLDIEPKIYFVGEAGEATPMIDGYIALGSGEYYARPRMEDWIRIFGGSPKLPKGIPKMIPETATFGVLYALEEAKKKTSSVGGDSHLSIITKNGWKDIDDIIPKYKPKIETLMSELESELVKKVDTNLNQDLKIA